MVRIRLTRTGRRNAPSYRIVVIDQKAKRDGKYIELIGHYNPIENPDKAEFKQDRYDHWISVGAQPSEAVAKLVKGTYKFKPYNPNAEEEEAETQPETAETETEATKNSDDSNPEEAKENKE